MPVTTTVEGRERYPGPRALSARVARRPRGDLERMLVAAMDGTHVPLATWRESEYARGRR
jgi:hypothetical protein